MPDNLNATAGKAMATATAILIQLDIPSSKDGRDAARRTSPGQETWSEGLVRPASARWGTGPEAGVSISPTPLLAA
jgi:hypothetical protein